MFKKILCAVDGSDNARRAAEVAAQLASKFGAKLTLLTVAKKLEVTEQVKRFMELEHISGEPQYVLDEMTEKILDEAKDAARAAGVPELKTEVKTGHPARTITQFADRINADCIVVGSRGMGDTEGFFLGSVSHKISSLAKCTVITVR
ncbi:MAG: universal stress protein [Rhodovibrionaceae bacterium]|nr:universal stress protein [Rhodovibrionaceae bacterium]